MCENGKRPARPSASERTSNCCCTFFGLSVFIRLSCFKSSDGHVVGTTVFSRVGGRRQEHTQDWWARSVRQSSEAVLYRFCPRRCYSAVPGQSRWLVSSAPGGAPECGVAVRLPHATVQRIDTSDNKLGILLNTWDVSATAWEHHHQLGRHQGGRGGVSSIPHLNERRVLPGEGGAISADIIRNPDLRHQALVPSHQVLPPSAAPMTATSPT